MRTLPFPVAMPLFVLGVIIADMVYHVNWHGPIVFFIGIPIGWLVGLVDWRIMGLRSRKKISGRKSYSVQPDSQKTVLRKSAEADAFRFGLLIGGFVCAIAEYYIATRVQPLQRGYIATTLVPGEF